MSKHQVLMRDVVCRYHPEFVRSRDLRKYGLAHAEIFNIERLIEESLAHVGGYDFVDEDRRDFNCPWDSDSKTTTVIPDGHSKTMIVSSVENKIGSLRVTIYNPFKNAVDFMYIPRNDVQFLKERGYGKSSYKEKIRARWTESKDFYNSCHDFLVPSFERLALAGG
jgi:putative component of membrane protein insertase Oxa1/YidC/SpoIIIJ protein YidD